MTTPGIIMTCFICAFIVIGIISSRTERQNKQLEQDKKAKITSEEIELKQDELSYISSVTALLPDSEAALNQLNDRYRWANLIGVIGIGIHQLTILRIVNQDKKVTLPNMQADHYLAEERYVVETVRKTTSARDDVGFYGVDAYAQEPTVDMLHNLVRLGYITIAEPVSKNSRTCDCELTTKGQTLLNLDNQHRSRNTSHSVLRALSEHERKAISDVLYLRLNKLN
jgi:hypothetical protein